MNPRVTETNVAPPDPAAVAIARTAFASWLRSERESRGLSLDDIARVTKIQMRALERLEDARFDELPADVFVRGFIRNYARVVGLDADQALARYDDCGVTPGPAASARARAMLDTVSAMAPDAARSGTFAPEAMRAGVRISDTYRVVREPSLLAAGSLRMPAAEQAIVEPAIVEPAVVESIAEPIVEAIAAAPIAEAVPEPVVDEAVVEAAPVTKGKRGRGKGRRAEPKAGSGKRRRGGAAEPVVAETAVEVVPVVEPVLEAAPVALVAEAAVEVDDLDAGIEITIIADEPTAPIQVPIPAMAAIAVMVTPPRSFRSRLTARGAAVSPTLIIDDADPDSAEREQEARRESNARRSFLPPALLDGDRGTRQGGLTLAVIILLIVATLTLSYLMRRPSSSGEGVTSADVSSAPLA